jgi:predicted lipase
VGGQSPPQSLAAARQARENCTQRQPKLRRDFRHGTILEMVHNDYDPLRLRKSHYGLTHRATDLLADQFLTASCFYAFQGFGHRRARLLRQPSVTLRREYRLLEVETCSAGSYVLKQEP